ncbi:MAG TPA: transcription antitermination factor NusB [Actinomycetes bacterium]|nr:transcription antitermination factor NusB [Actinomycetes bacterium]
MPASARTRRSRPARTDPARRVAYDLLRAVDEHDSYANLALPALLRQRGLHGRDAALATELAYGTLRGRGTYDAVLAACVDRPLDQLDPPVLDVLRLGAHQLLETRIPPHAAVASTVALAREALTAGPAGLVNAVLRRVAEHDLPTWLARLAPDAEADPDGHLAVTTSHPAWVVRALRDALRADGRDPAELARLLAADNRAPAVTLVARPGRASRDELVAAGANPGRWSPYAAVLPAGDPAGVPAVAAGRAGVQDEGSQLVALMLRAAPLAGPDTRWADLCAGPGGKAALLAALADPVGAELVAVESAAHRADLVRRALTGTPGRWRVEVGDGRAVGAAVTDGAVQPYDRVLVDAPCTGLGALRRRPEARWRKTPADVATLTRLQRELLGSALDAVRPGGVVAYATCSPHVAETRVVVDDVLRRRGDVEALDAGAVLRDVAPDLPLGPGPYAQLWPHVHRTDAMFVALLTRR